MPEHIRGPSGTPRRGDSQQLFVDTLAQLEQLTEAIAEIAAQLAELRASMPVSPRHHPYPRRRGGTVLHLVRVAVIFAAGLGVVLALAPGGGARSHRVAGSRPGVVAGASTKPRAGS